MNKHKIILSFLFYFTTFNVISYSQNREPTIEEKITAAFDEYEKTDKVIKTIETLFFIDHNNLEFKNLCLKAKVGFLRALKARFYSKFESAREYANEALILSSNCQNQFIKGWTHILLGETQVLDKKLDNRFLLSIENFKKAIFIFEESKKKPSLSYTIDANYDLSFSYFAIKNWEASLQSGLKCVKTIDAFQIKLNRLKYIYSKMALAHIKLKNHKEAELYIEKASFQTPKGYNNARSMINMASAELYKSKGDFKSAYLYMRISDSLYKRYINYTIDGIKESVNHEYELNEQLVASKIQRQKEQKFLMFLSGAFLVFSLLYVLKFFKLSRKLRNKVSEIRVLNNKVQNSLINIKSSNLSLEQKNEKIEQLLNLNERTLFSKTLKISTYNDSITKVRNEISKLIESDSDIKKNQLHHIEKSLFSIVSDDELWEDFKIQFEKIKPAFFKNLKQKHPSLSVNDLKHCSYIISKLNTKDVANLISVSPRSVETTRYRIKKKLDLDKEINLYDFLQNL